MSKRTTCISTSKQSVTRKVINNVITMNVTRSLQSAARANVKVAGKALEMLGFLGVFKAFWGVS